MAIGYSNYSLCRYLHSFAFHAGKVYYCICHCSFEVPLLPFSLKVRHLQ